MKTLPAFLFLTLAALILSSCGVIPTLPPMDSTVTIRTPQFTLVPRLVTVTSEPLEETQIVNTDDPEEPTATLKPAVTTVTAEPQLPTYTQTAAVSATPSYTATSAVTETTTPTFTPTAVPYSLQLMNPFYLKNFTHPELDCNWLGVAGQIFNSDGLVQKEIVIRAGGKINGSPVVEEMTMPLTEPEIDLAYGPGGFELTLATTVVDSETELWIQLFNLAGDPLSEKIVLVTYDDCQKNLILLNFIEE